VRQGGLGILWSLLLPVVSVSFAELPIAPCWGRASGGSQPLWSIRATMRKGQGRIFHFQWETNGDYWL
jgi:hypothetical protein